MTFIAGISDSKSCILTADNVVTGPLGTIIRDGICTTTGVTIPANMDERTFKIMYPLPNCIMSFAGSDKVGYALGEGSSRKAKTEIQRGYSRLPKQPHEVSSVRNYCYIRHL